jgi:hypothetical protein
MIKVLQNGTYLVQGHNVTAERRHLRDSQASVCSVPLRRLHQPAVLRRNLLSNRVQSAEAAVQGRQDDKPATKR